MSDQLDTGVRRIFNVQLRVTNERTGVSQIHDVLTKADDEDDAEERAEEKVLSDDEDVFETVEITDLGTVGDE